MGIAVNGVSIQGTHLDEMLLATHGAASALFQEVGPVNPDTMGWNAWNRKVQAADGNDVILRDRPGDYKQTAEFTEIFDGQAFDVTTVGNVLVDGGPGEDRVSYASYSHGGIEIDLEPVAQELLNDPDHWNAHVGVAGTAKAYGPSTTDIFGLDYLARIENATGTNQDDLIKGSNTANSLKGLDGDDEIEGRGGHDTLKGDNGNDTMRGGDGNDALDGGNHNDTLYGDAGNDGIVGGGGRDNAYGGDGNDTISGGDDKDKIWGGNGDDLLFGNDGNDYIHTGGFFNGIDEANGGDGDDKIVVGRFDTANGGAGTDTVVVSPGGFVGNDAKVFLNWAGDGQFGRMAADGGFLDTGTLVDIENVITGSGDDHVWISDLGANEVETKRGNDFVSTDAGDDIIDTGAGHDQAYGGSGDDEIDAGSGNDYVDGGTGEDEIDGGSGDDELFGRENDDEIDGGSGDDYLTGGSGEDVMTGGTGSDGFIWKEGDSGLDTITDFQIGEDFLVITDFLKDPVPVGGSYVGKVFAFNNTDGNAFLSAKTDDGWEAFVELEGINANTAWNAIQSGELFSAGTLGGEGPGGWAPQPSPFDDSSPFGQIDDGWSTDSLFL